MAYSLEELRSYLSAAKSNRSTADNLYRDVYKYAIPNRDMMETSTPGQDKTIEIYDSTAVDSTESFANFCIESLTPPEYRWMSYSVGPDVPAAMRDRVQTLLDAVTEKFFYLLGMTNFDQEVGQAYTDLAAGTGVMGIRDYGKFGSEEAPATFVSTPPYEIYPMEGREGHINMVFREFEICPTRIKTIWPDANIPDNQYDSMVGDRHTNGSTKKVKIAECCYFDYEDKQYYYSVFLCNSSDGFLVDEKMMYASWIVFRWSVVSGEMFGRGPLISALADIKTANKIVELVLQNASIALSGIYTAVDDGVLNPNTVELVPGTIIPVGSNGGNMGKSLDLLARSGDFDLSELVLKDIRQAIRRKLLDDDLAPLDDAVRSSREVAARQQMANRRAGPNFGRVRVEFIYRTVKELTTMWQAKGLLPPFKIDGKNITLRFTSPLAKQQNEEDLVAMDRYIARMNVLQPGSAPVIVKPEEYAHWAAERSGVQIKLINSKDQLVQAQQILGQKIAQGGPEAEQIVKGFTDGP